MRALRSAFTPERAQDRAADVIARLAVCIALPALAVLLTPLWPTTEPHPASPLSLHELFSAEAITKIFIAVALAPIFETPVFVLQVFVLVNYLRISEIGSALLTGLTWACLHSFLRGEGIFGISAIATFPMFFLSATAFLAWRSVSTAKALGLAAACHLAWNLSTIVGFFVFSITALTVS
jgi:hypothetical protein